MEIIRTFFLHIKFILFFPLALLCLAAQASYTPPGGYLNPLADGNGNLIAPDIKVLNSPNANPNLANHEVLNPSPDARLAPYYDYWEFYYLARDNYTNTAPFVASHDQKDLSFDTSCRLAVAVYKPAGWNPASGKVVIFIHGGGWASQATRTTIPYIDTTLDTSGVRTQNLIPPDLVWEDRKDVFSYWKDDMTIHSVVPFLEKGYLVFYPTYRGSSLGGDGSDAVCSGATPEQIDWSVWKASIRDIQQVYYHVVNILPVFMGSQSIPENIVDVFGLSAGAHLATLLASHGIGNSQSNYPWELAHSLPASDPLLPGSGRFMIHSVIGFGPPVDFSMMSGVNCSVDGNGALDGTSKFIDNIAFKSLPSYDISSLKTYSAAAGDYIPLAPLPQATPDSVSYSVGTVGGNANIPLVLDSFFHNQILTSYSESCDPNTFAYNLNNNSQDFTNVYFVYNTLANFYDPNDTSTPPIKLITGSADNLVPPEMSIAFCENVASKYANVLTYHNQNQIGLYPEGDSHSGSPMYIDRFTCGGQASKASIEIWEGASHLASYPTDPALYHSGLMLPLWGWLWPQDSDGDGVADIVDAFPSNDAASVDDNGDGYPDRWNEPLAQSKYGCVLGTPTCNGLVLGSALAVVADADSDGLSNSYEILVTHTDPLGITSSSPICTDPVPNKDTDGDGLEDSQECAYATNPLNNVDPVKAAVNDSIILGVDRSDTTTSGMPPLIKSWYAIDGSWLGSASLQSTFIDVAVTETDFFTLSADGVYSFYLDRLVLPVTNGIKVVASHLDGYDNYVCVLSKDLATNGSSVTCAFVTANGPVGVSYDHDDADVAVGPGFRCVVHRSDGNIGCMNTTYEDDPRNMLTVLGITSWTNGLGAISIAAGKAHFCAIIHPDSNSASTSVKCWSPNDYGQKGDNNSDGLVDGVTNAVSIAAGDYHTCVIATTDGTQTLSQGHSAVQCWGAGTTARQSASPTAEDQFQSVVPAGLVNPVAIHVGGHRTCVIQAKQDPVGSNGNTVENDIMCWPIGLNMSEQAAPADSNGDGVPDVWALQNGVNPQGASIGNVIAPNGLTYLFDYTYSLNPNGSNIANTAAPGDSLSGCTVSWTYLQINQHNLNPAVCNYVLTVRNNLNNDRISDLLMRDLNADGYQGQWKQFSIQNGVVLASNLVNYAPISTDYVYQGMLDANGDGTMDILVRRQSTHNWYVYTVINGNVVNSSPSALSMTNDTNWQYQGSGDFNGDGIDDVLVRNTSTGAWWIYYLQGSSVVTSGSPTGLYVSSDFIFQSAGDMNGDGWSEVLIRSTSTGNWYVYNRHLATPVTSQLIGENLTSSSLQFKAMIDINGDGKQDIVLKSSSDVWSAHVLSFSNPNFSTAAFSLSSSTNTLNNSIYQAATLASYGDFNGDGKGDLLLKDSSGQYYMFLTTTEPMLATNLVFSTPTAGWSMFK